jgi:hypothetical protein
MGTHLFQIEDKQEHKVNTTQRKNKSQQSINQSKSGKNKTLCKDDSWLTK